MRKIKKNRQGLTLIELILSIAIIGMIIVSFMPLFVMSAKNNSKADNTLDATYLGKDAMELAYHLSKTETVRYNDLNSSPTDLNAESYVYQSSQSTPSDLGTPSNPSHYVYKKDCGSDRYIEIRFSKDDGDRKIVKVLVVVYKDQGGAGNQLEVQYESLYFWEEV